MKKSRLVILVLLIAISMAACSKSKKEAVDEDKDVAEIKGKLVEFWESMKITQDELYKAAIVNQDSEPDKARDYFNAHTTLRNLIYDSNGKSFILAAILQKEPTAFRPMPFEVKGDKFDITVALGPTDENTGVLCMRKKDDKWFVYDFDGIWQDHVAKKSQDDPNAMLFGD